jgi:hypothetical protein
VDFNIVANGFGSMTYQWQWLCGSWIDLSNSADVSGTTTPDLRIQNVDSRFGILPRFVSSSCVQLIPIRCYWM